jgi:hypothetical protein
VPLGYELKDGNLYSSKKSRAGQNKKGFRARAPIYTSAISGAHARFLF